MTIRKSSNLNQQQIRKKKLFGNQSKYKKSQKDTEAAKKRKHEIEEAEKISKKFKSTSDSIANIELGKLTYENITEGQVILGCIAIVKEFEMIISLPHRMSGCVTIQHISNSYKSLLTKVANEGSHSSENIVSLDRLFPIGHFVMVKVIGLSSVVDENERKTVRISLSMLPHDVNGSIRTSILTNGSLLQCAVESEEDNGFVMSAGLLSVRSAFLSKQNCPLNFASISVGSVLMCSVVDISRDEVDDDEEEQREGAINIKLTAESKVIYANIFEVNDKTNINSLLPGTLLEMKVEKIRNDGLMLSSLHVHGVVHVHNLQTPFQKLSNFLEGDKLLARILYTANISHDLYLTLNENICSGLSSSEQMKGIEIHDYIENAKIVKINPHGCRLLLNKEDNVLGYCALSHLSDRNFSSSTVDRKYRQDTLHKCRIIMFNFIDQLFIVSLKSSMVFEKAKVKGDLKVGQVIRVRILKFIEAGAHVRIRRKLIGFVPRNHLTDALTSEPEKKFLLGEVVTARILSLFPDSAQNPVLTLKSRLVESKLEILKDFDISNVGKIADGIVTKVYSKGLLVSFYDNVCGIVPISDIVMGVHKNLKDIYVPNNIVSCRVFKCIPEDKEMFLSLKLRLHLSLKVGEIVDAVRVTGRKDDLVKVSYKDDVKGIIPVHHLSDDVEQGRALFNLVKTGDVFKKPVLIHAKNKQNKVMIFSLKASFYRAALSYKGDSVGNKLIKGDVVPSVVSGLSEKELFLRLFKGNLSSPMIIPVNQIFNSSFEAPHSLNLSGIEIGQSLIVKCKKVSVESDSQYLTTSLTDLQPDIEVSSLQYLLNYMTGDMTMRSHLQTTVVGLTIGSKHKARIVSLKAKKFGIMVHLVNLNVPVDGIISLQHLDRDIDELKAGEEIEVKILHINFAEMCVELTTKSKSKILSTSDHGLNIGQEVTCEVLLPKRNFILCRLINGAVGQVVYLPSKRHLNDLKGRREYYEIGVLLKIRIRYIRESLVLADLLVHCRGSRSVTLMTTMPEVEFSANCSSFNSLSDDKNLLTAFDFQKRMSKKIENATEGASRIKKSLREDNLSLTDKLQILKRDDFSQFNEKYFWSKVSQMRKERKKLKKRGVINRKTLNSKNSLTLIEKDAETIEFDDDAMDVSGNTNEYCKAEMETDDNEQVSLAKSKKIDSNNCLELSSTAGGFDFAQKSSSANQEDSTSDDEPEVNHKQKRKLTKKEKLQLTLEKERKLRELELRGRDPDTRPVSVNDFELLLQKESHASASWLSYIAFHLANSEIESARLVARRALQAIPSRKEEDRLTVWSALLRTEVMHGTPDTTEKTFKEAIITNDFFKISEVMANIYEEANNFQEADEIYKKLVKKYSLEREIWIKAAHFNFRNQRLKQARKLLERAYISIPKSEHIELVNRFAQFEFKYGESERARTLFESALSNFPKRLDIWLVYADQLTKKEDFDGVRNIFERLLNQKLKIQQMKTVFKKLLSFEEKHGNNHSVTVVKRRVKEYVESTLKQHQ